jgi:phage shock protein A
LQAVKAGTKTITSPDRVKELLQTLKQLRDSIKATEGQVRQSMQSARTSALAKDFAAAKTSVEQAISVVESRIALKQQVNTALKELVTLLG